MSVCVAITRVDRSADARRCAASRMRDGAVVRRALALAMVLEGASRAAAAQSCGMDRQTIRDWIHRYNAEGIGGLYDRPHPGRPARLSPAQMTDLKRVVIEGRTQLGMAWCAGAASTCGTRSPAGSRRRFTSARLASC